MKKYTCIFIDLDDTLWDFKTNAYLSLQDVYAKYELKRYFSSFEHFSAYTPSATNNCGIVTTETKSPKNICTKNVSCIRSGKYTPQLPKNFQKLSATTF